MTIAQAFNEITVAQGGTPNYSGTISGAIDALNDALAGSDQPSAQTIEGAVRLLGQHIGGGGGAQSGYIYIYETADGEVSQEKPWGKVYVDGNEVQSTTTLSVLDFQNNIVTAYGYEIPAGSFAKYEPNTTVATSYPNKSFYDYIFANPEDASDPDSIVLVDSSLTDIDGLIGIAPTPSATPSVLFALYEE